MIFIFSFIKEKFTNIRKNHRKNPNKLRIIMLWITLITILTLSFYHFGAFNFEKKNNVTSQLNSLNKKTNNIFLPAPIKQKPINNSFRNKKPDKKIYKIVPKENVEKIDSILAEVKKMPVPQNYTNDDYNFE